MKKTRLIIFTLTVLSIIMLPNITHADSITVQVDPSTFKVHLGETFTVNITVNDVTDLAVWEFQLYYLNTVLNCTGVAEGPFLEQGGSTFFVSQIDNEYNATHGRLLAGCTLLGAVPGVDGSGTLITVTFQAKATGTTPLHLANTELKDSSEPPRNHISHTTNDGIVYVELVAGHDVAVTDVVSSKTVVGEGCSTSIYVTVYDQGEHAETFNVTAYANTSVIETRSVTLTSGDSIVVTFTWDTTGFAKGNYTISATAATIPGEIDTADNTYTDGWILVTILGDVDGNFKVNILDISIIARAYQSKPGDPNWNPNADLDNNNIINILDIAKAAVNYGKKI